MEGEDNGVAEFKEEVIGLLKKYSLLQDKYISKRMTWGEKEAFLLGIERAIETIEELAHTSDYLTKK